MDLLKRIVENKREELASRKRGQSVEEMRRRALDASRPPSLRAVLEAAPGGMGLIAEAKPRSPSAGPIRTPFDGAAVARAFAEAGAQAMSVLMDERHFGGGESLWTEVRAAVDLPLLYKEFVIDPWQVWHARTLGASGVLLLAGVLDADTLRRLHDLVAEAGLEALVEVHDEAELEKAVAVNPTLLGINNRDLRTFTVSLATTERLAAQAPASALLVSESGIRRPADVARVKAAGARAVLVGEHLLRQDDPGVGVRNLMDEVWHERS